MVASLPAALDDDHPANQVDGAHAGSAAQPDFMFFVPTGRVERDVARAVLAGENAREEDPVVAAERLVAVDLDGETVRRAGDELLEEPRAGHAGADDQEPRPLAHGPSPSPDSMRAAQT